MSWLGNFVIDWGFGWELLTFSSISFCCCIWARLVLSGCNLIVRGTIFRSSAVPNNGQSCWVFHLLGESCTTNVYQIWSGVFFSMITTCDRSDNSTFLVTRGSCSAVSKGVVHSWAVCSSVLVFFRLFLVAQSNFDDLKGLESVLEFAIYGQQVNGTQN